ncbi:MAG: dynamin family protein [Marinosulfonomonas sp.]|nr:dynamin family protein [Marinosulfonomonas sp.]
MTQFRKPRIALMGEFSAGKSSLCNLLMGKRRLLEKVTATQLPPVWLSYGDTAPYREDLDGERHPIDLDRLMDIPLEETLLVRIFVESDILTLCDLIDMPGISDPRMASEVWERTTHLADGVLWCTHATQAWRQSEAGVWASMPEKLRERSFLLLTRFDKIMNDKDRLRVLKRVRNETQGLFAKFFPISLTRAMAAAEDYDKWVASGAAAFTDSFIELINKLAKEQTEPADTQRTPVGHIPAAGEDSNTETKQVYAQPQRVMPRRIPRPQGQTARPSPTHKSERSLLVDKPSAAPDNMDSLRAGLITENEKSD